MTVIQPSAFDGGYAPAPPGAELAVSTLPHDIDIPLVVDLDGTLLASDALAEGLLAIAFHRPLAMVALPAAAMRGRAGLKERVHQLCEIDVRHLPLRPEVVELVRAERAAGRAVHLVTAAEQAVASSIAQACGLFDTATGSRMGRNLKGAEKLAYLRAEFGGRFLYAGDSRADDPIFQAATGAVLVGPAVRRRARLEASGVRVARAIAATGGGVASWTRLLRVRHWAKNLIIAAPLFLSQQVTDPAAALAVITGFLLWCVLASGTYVLNDLADLRFDRQHPTKRSRPLAAGAIPLVHGVAAAVVLIVLPLVLSAWLLPLAFTSTLFAYLVLTILYSMRLKRVPLVDCNVIGVLFMQRVVAGMAVLGLPISLWLASFTMTMFTSFALAKRHAELHRIAQERPERATGRGYETQDLSVTLSFGVGYALAALLIMLLYFQFEAGSKGLYGSIEWLFAIPVVLLSWNSRVWLMANRGTLEDDPVEFALRDAVSWWHAAACLLLWLLAAWS